MPGPPSDRDIRTLENELTALIGRSRRFVSQVAAQVHPDLTPPAYVILARLVDDGSMRAGHLAEIANLDRATISRQVRQLEKLGLVERQPDPEDARAQILSATADGHARRGRALDRAHVDLAAQLVDWSAKDVHTLGALLGRLNALQSRS